MSDDRPWWLWPNLLGLDAPVVALVWQQFLADVAGVHVPLAAGAVLGLVVWGVYLGDRWLDARHGSHITDRHRFAARHPFAIALCAAIALAAAAIISLRLPVRYLDVGSITAAAVAGYFAIVHAGLSDLLPGSKEMAVGLMFSSGVAIPLIASSTGVGHRWLPGVVAFAGLCWLNCTLINRWEEAESAPLGSAAAAAALAAAAAALASSPVRIAILASTGLLVGLHIARSQFSDRSRRVLADFVLLTPLVVGVLS